MTKKTEIITVDQAIADGSYVWDKTENDIDFKGIIPGYAMGFCIEVKKEDGSIGYSSCTFVYDDIDEIRTDYHNMNELGMMADLCLRPGREITGRIVFRGYYESEWDPEEKDYGYIDRSSEVLKLYDRYKVEEV